MENGETKPEFDSKSLCEFLGLGLIDFDGHKNLPEEVLVEAASGRFFSQPFIEICKFGVASENINFRKALARNPFAPPEILNLIVNDSDFSVRMETGKNSSCTTQQLRTLVANCVNLVAPRMMPFVISKGFLNLSMNPSTPFDMLEELSICQDPTIRAGVARNYSTPAYILEGLAEDPHADVRIGAAKHPCATPRLLALLIDDACDDIRLSVARNHNTPPDVLLRLAYSNENFRVKSLKISREFSLAIAIAGNPFSPIEALEYLGRFGEEFSAFGDDLVLAVCANPATPAGLLARIAEKQNSSAVKQVIASNPSAPIEMLYEFAESEDVYLRKAVAINSKSDEAILLALKKDTSKLIQAIVFCKTGDPGLDHVVETSSYRVLLAALEFTRVSNNTILDKFANGSRSRIRSMIANYANTPPEILEKLGRSDDNDVQRAVVRNPNTPLSICQEIARSRYIRYLCQPDRLLNVNSGN
jgi:hypothetical protein